MIDIAPCACCGLEYTPLVWGLLPKRGYQDCGDPETVLELRNCRCGTTRAREISRASLAPSPVRYVWGTYPQRRNWFRTRLGRLWRGIQDAANRCDQCGSLPIFDAYRLKLGTEYLCASCAQSQGACP